MASLIWMNFLWLKASILGGGGGGSERIIPRRNVSFSVQELQRLDSFQVTKLESSLYQELLDQVSISARLET